MADFYTGRREWSVHLNWDQIMNAVNSHCATTPYVWLKSSAVFKKQSHSSKTLATNGKSFFRRKHSQPLAVQIFALSYLKKCPSSRSLFQQIHKKWKCPSYHSPGHNPQCSLSLIVMRLKKMPLIIIIKKKQKKKTFFKPVHGSLELGLSEQASFLMLSM